MRKTNYRKQAEQDDSEINITPMLDVVFIMLIFFIVTATFVKETGTEVTRPTAEKSKLKDKASILIAIDAKNTIWIDHRKVDIRSVRPNIERLRAENPQGSVVILADKESYTETVMSVMDASRQAGVYDVAIATDK